MNQQWALGILGAILLTFVGWEAKTLIQHDIKINDFEKVIPPQVERSLGELRDKTNKQSDTCNTAAGVVANNTVEISHLKETVGELRAEVEKLRDKK
jgi:hypothetical protein